MVTALCCGSLGWSAMTVKAELEERLLYSSRTMLDFPPEWLSSEPRTVVINGARVRIFSGRSELSMEALLDYVQQRCASNDGGLTNLLDKAQRKLGRVERSRLSPTLRAESDRDGVVACLALGQQALTSAQLQAKMAHFTESLDVNAFGGVRMVRVVAREHGSFFVVAMTEGPASLAAMFPAHGDAPGADFSDLPRPARATRLLSAWQENGEPALNAYQVERAPDEVWAEQLERMTAVGFRALDEEQSQSAEKHAVLLWRDGRVTLMVADAFDGKTLLSLLPLDGAVRENASR